MTYEWLARDKSGDLWLFGSEPSEQEVVGFQVSGEDQLDAYEIDARAFPEIAPGTKRRVKIELQ